MPPVTIRHAISALILALSAVPALAQVSEQPKDPASAPAATTPADIWSRANLLGDVGGLRSWLANGGVTVSLTELTDLHGNATGGVKQGTTVGGLATLTIQVDTAKAFGWEGGLFNASALQIHGRNLSQYYLGNIQTASGIEAAPSTRLWELWYQQSFGGTFDVRLGQQSVDQEFITSTGSAIFINTAMGWPALPSVDLYAGGPAYPLSSLGIRLRGQPLENVTVLGGVFQDNPPGGAFANDSQLLGATRSGANFNLRTGALFIAEAQYSVNLPSTDDSAPKPAGLPASYKIGAYYDTAGFPDQRFDTTGQLLASSSSNGQPRLLRGNGMLYGVIDQGVWQEGGDGARLVSVFARAMGSPADRNLVDFSFNGGVTLKAPLPGRDNDILGVGYGIAKIGGNASAADRDRAALSGVYVPIRSSESSIEVTYQAQVTPWLQVQPDFQYVFTPAGGIANPVVPGKRLANEAIFGVRSGITF